jgi:hypothetical protein
LGATSRRRTRPFHQARSASRPVRRCPGGWTTTRMPTADGLELRSHSQHDRHIRPARASGGRDTLPRAGMAQPLLNRTDGSELRAAQVAAAPTPPLTWQDSIRRPITGKRSLQQPTSQQLACPDQATPCLTWAFMRWQVMGSNHRRLSRRFYIPEGAGRGQVAGVPVFVAFPGGFGHAGRRAGVQVERPAGRTTWTPVRLPGSR